MQRMSYSIVQGGQQNTTVWYLDTTGENLSFKNDSTYSAGSSNGSSDTIGNVRYSAFLDALYSAAFLPPNPSQSLWFDGWGNTQIPLVGNLGSTTNLSEWQAVPGNLQAQDYSSTYGIPVEKLQDGETDFTLCSAYWTLDCTKPSVTSYDAIDQSNYALTQSPGETLYMGMEFPQPSNQSFIGMLYFASAIIGPNGNFSVAGDTPLVYSACKFNQTFVETNMSCLGTQCSPVNMRLMPNPPSTQIPTTFTDWMTYASADQPSLTERYIWNPDPTAMDNLDPQNGFDLSSISQTDFTQRLAMAINTFWTIGFAPMYITGGLTHYPNKTTGVSVLNTTGMYTSINYVYTYDPAWLSILFICSGILLLAGMAGVIWESRTIGPNVLGFASSIVRHSKYIDVPKASSTMSGPERARMMGNVKVMMQDVKACDEVGRIALGTVSEGAQRLKPGRLYR
jgi:hypothetical protein